jgi:hypothetical protein
MRNPPAEQAATGLEAGIQTASRLAASLVGLAWRVLCLVALVLALFGIVMSAVHDEIALEFPWGARIDPLDFFQSGESEGTASEPPAQKPAMALPFSLTIQPGTRERVCMMREATEVHDGAPRTQRGHPRRRE